ncbi:hypothetical protein [Halosolutus halophilus]|uniref:hypothetical protein n=1 Tax=Halosolutus halophilus TaxID=1552990 RepID=UPI00223526F0|nr:hypothetical protein [Halosolutus halophilus]
MVQDLTAYDLSDLDPEVLLEEALQDDAVLRLIEDAVRIGRAHASGWMGAVNREDIVTLDPEYETE